MVGKKKNKLLPVYCAAGFIAVVLLSLAIWLVVSLLGFDNTQKPQRIHQITLVKPPPPPPPEEKPPEPEIEEKIEDVLEEVPDEVAESTEETSSDLGIDAEGGAGSDGFGLVGKKGGKALIGGESSTSLLRKYEWYNNIIQQELSDQVRQILEEQQGLPEGKLKGLVRIRMDTQGNVVDYKLLQSSGNKSLDQAIQQALEMFRISEPPPSGMPMMADIRVNSQG